jgi:hypothetical protein
MNTDIGVYLPRAVSCLVLNLLRWRGASDHRLASEGQAGIMLPLLFERFPNMRLDPVEDVVWKGFGFRGPLNLPVRLAG